MVQSTALANKFTIGAAPARQLARPPPSFDAYLFPVDFPIYPCLSYMIVAWMAFSNEAEKRTGAR